MAYYYDPFSYASSFHSSPFTRRRPSPSPPPTTYHPRASRDPYFRALAEEQAARADLQEAIQRERQARQRCAQEESRARARAFEQARKEALARQRAQQFYGYPGFGYGNYEDEEEQEESYPFSPFFHAMKREHEPVRRRQSPQPARSQSSSPLREEHTANPSPKVSIPITTPRPQPSSEEKNAAASKIQSLYRTHASLSSIRALRARFAALLASFSFPTTLDFDIPSNAIKGESERPKLAYTAHNAPLHAHEDALLKLLQSLDAIESRGDLRVREARKELVREIEAELKKVDEEVRRRWEETRAATTTPVSGPVEEASADAAAEAIEAEPIAEQRTGEDETPGAKTSAEAETSSPSTPVEPMDAEPLPLTPAPTAVPSAEESTSLDLPAKQDSALLDLGTQEEPEAEEVMDVEVEVEPYILSTPPIENKATEPIIEDSPVPALTTAIDSPAESESDVRTPPALTHVSLPAAVHEPEPIEAHRVQVPVLGNKNEKADIDIADADADALPVAPPQPTSKLETVLKGEVPNSIGVPEEDSLAESDAEVEDVVLVDADADADSGRPSSPAPSSTFSAIEPEKEFVLV